MRFVFLILAFSILCACSPSNYKTTGSIERLDPALDQYIAKDAKIEIIAKGFDWSEGPVWVPNGNYLLFTDVPANIMYKWSEKEGLSEFLNPSGPPQEDVPYMSAPGANGLIMGEEFNHIYMANHGKRAIIAMDLRSKGQTELANNYNGQKFSSPNDLVLSSYGSIFFTDPPFGLKGGNANDKKETTINGVYRIDPDGFTHLLIDDFNLPNGIGLSPDETTLYVLISDGPFVMAYDLDKDGNVSNPRKFYDFKISLDAKKPGTPDGLAITQDGTLFLTGPGGVHVVTSQGKLLGIIDPGSLVSNVTLGENGTRLYITADNHLVRLAINATTP